MLLVGLRVTDEKEMAREKKTHIPSRATTAYNNQVHRKTGIADPQACGLSDALMFSRTEMETRMGGSENSDE